MATQTLDTRQLSITTIRTLSMDGVQKANSGHPGTPMALAPVAYAVWSQFLKFDPKNPHWSCRDRFVLSCGHASMLLYSLLHLAEVRKVAADGRVLDEPSISLENLKNFRQLHSPCAGHPEYGEAAGIETTTGPLGQGIATSVGMAIASEWLCARYERPGYEGLFGFNVYALCSDGDLMEGVGCEAASLAGHLKLSNLCWIYDDNHITIEGKTDLAFSEDVARRFEGLGWRVLKIADANRVDDIVMALEKFGAEDERPTLIIVRSIIGWGAPNKANHHDAHGAPLGAAEIRLTKEFYGVNPDEDFAVPGEVREHFSETLGTRGGSASRSWTEKFGKYKKQFPNEGAEFEQIQKRELPIGWEKSLPEFGVEEKSATRVSSGKVLNALGKKIPWLLGGSADLAPSTKTLLEFPEAGHFLPGTRGGRNFHFGIREHAMAAAGNGMAITGLRPYVSTFFVFSDYLRPAMRLSAIMHQPVIYIYTHDSIGLGEDGPTHQPVEQLAACRAIPGLVVLRPGDANEVAQAYQVALSRKNGPTALVLTRQNVPTLCRKTYAPAAGVLRGGYILAEAEGGAPKLILMGTGSELQLCVSARESLQKEGIPTRVVSFPSWELFEAQEASYRAQVLPANVPARVAVEAGIEQGWQRYLGNTGQFVGMRGYGASAPYEELYEHFGITVAGVIAAARKSLKG
jgi:transketolase